MDVGVWGGGPSGNAKTTFGLICGNEILLCSWLNLDGTGVSPFPQYKQMWLGGEYKFSSGTKKFFDRARTLGRGFVRYNARSNEPLTDSDSPLIVIPDLHLHLYKGELIDRFQFLPRSAVEPGRFAKQAREKGLGERCEELGKYQAFPQYPQLTSLDEELRNAIQVAKDSGATVVQIGDLYEVWEAEVLMRMQYLEMSRMESNLRESYKVDLRSDYKRMLTARKVVPRDLHSRFDYAANTKVLPDQVVDKYSVDFARTSEICAAIRASHPILFQGENESKLFDYQIDGNHDNQKMNQYWTQYSPGEYRNNEILCGGTLNGKRHKEQVNTEIGTGTHPIYIAHGHRYDWHNNDDNWWKKEAGFDTVLSFLIGGKSFGDGLLERNLKGTLDTGGDKGREFADWWAETHNYDMRKPGCRLADEVFLNNPNVRLFIMGHTHDPQLWMTPCRCSLAERLPGWREYVLGEYWVGKEYYKASEYAREKVENAMDKNPRFR